MVASTAYHSLKRILIGRDFFPQLCKFFVQLLDACVTLGDLLLYILEIGNGFELCYCALVIIRSFCPQHNMDSLIINRGFMIFFHFLNECFTPKT